MKRTQTMVAEIEKAMADDLKSLDWMTPKTKQQAEIKLKERAQQNRYRGEMANLRHDQNRARR